MLLNLASGTDLRPPPWVNLDIVARWPGTERGCDVLWDARKNRLPFDDNSADGAYAGYLFLHLAPHHHERVLADIRRVLKPGATLMVGEVEMDKVMQRWIAEPTDKRLAELIWGEMGDVHGEDFAEFDKHCHGYSEATLRGFLERGGFDVVERTTIHGADVWYELTLVARKN